jgi:hypothetical protein
MVLTYENRVQKTYILSITIIQLGKYISFMKGWREEVGKINTQLLCKCLHTLHSIVLLIIFLTFLNSSFYGTPYFLNFNTHANDSLHEKLLTALNILIKVNDIQIFNFVQLQSWLKIQLPISFSLWFSQIKKRILWIQSLSLSVYLSIRLSVGRPFSLSLSLFLFI